MTELNQDAEQMSLRETLLAPGKNDAVVSDCVILVDQEVASKQGMASIPVKTGYKIVKGIKPGFVAMVVERLLPDFADALDPFWKAGRKSGEPAGYLRRHSEPAAEALLGVTDARIEFASSPVRGAYNRLRGTAKKHVEAAIPRLADLLVKHAD